MSTTDVVGGAPQDEGIGKVRSKVYGIARGQMGGACCRSFRGLSIHFDVNILLGGWQVSDEILRNHLFISNSLF